MDCMPFFAIYMPRKCITMNRFITVINSVTLKYNEEFIFLKRNNQYF